MRERKARAHFIGEKMKSFKQLEESKDLKDVTENQLKILLDEAENSFIETMALIDSFSDKSSKIFQKKRGKNEPGTNKLY